MPEIIGYEHENYVYIFFAVFVLIGLFLWSYHWKASKMALFAHIDSIRKISDTVSLTKTVIKKIMICIVYLLIVYALMRPQGMLNQKIDEKSKNSDNKISTSLSFDDLQKQKDKGENKKVIVRENARDILFLLDVSASMGAQDLYPSRLEKAKEMIHDIISALDGEHVGLIVFTSIPSVKCVLTIDYTYFKQILDKVKINDNDYSGTKLKLAMEEVIEKQFDFSENKFKELIIITDGGDTDLEILTGDDKLLFEKSLYLLAKKAFEEKKIKIHTIGLGTKAGSVVYGLKNEAGMPVRSSLNEKLLKKISKNTKGIYVQVDASNVDMKDIYLKKIARDRFEDFDKEEKINMDKDKINEIIQKQREKETQKIVYKELYIYPLILAIIFLIAEFFISEKKI